MPLTWNTAWKTLWKAVWRLSNNSQKEQPERTAIKNSQNIFVATVAPVDHADHVVAWFFGQAFFEKGCDHANRVWG